MVLVLALCARRESCLCRVCVVCVVCAWYVSLSVVKREDPFTYTYT
jgi:hypothetical protein